MGNLSKEELLKAANTTAVVVEETGGSGSLAGGGVTKKKKRGKTVVPIAMGIDATDRDLYNAVASLLNSVRALHGNITAPKPDGEIKIDLSANQSRVPGE